MDTCSSYRELDMADAGIDPSRVRAISDSWGVVITKDGKVRVPVCSYDDIMPLIRKRPDINK